MNYNQYLEDYWPKEESDNSTTEQYQIYDGPVSCIDRQIAELEARRDALLNGYCFTGYLSTKQYLDHYGLCDKELLSK